MRQDHNAILLTGPSRIGSRTAIPTSVNKEAIQCTRSQNRSVKASKRSPRQPSQHTNCHDCASCQQTTASTGYGSQHAELTRSFSHSSDCPIVETSSRHRGFPRAPASKQDLRSADRTQSQHGGPPVNHRLGAEGAWTDNVVDVAALGGQRFSLCVSKWAGTQVSHLRTVKCHKTTQLFIVDQLLGGYYLGRILQDF